MKLSKLWMGLLVLIPGLSMANATISTPISQYVSELPSQTSAQIGSTSLNHTYLPIVGGTLSLNTTANRNISESYSYPKTSGGSGISFSLTVINNQPSAPLYIFVQGSLSATPWGTNACEVPAQTTEEYMETCVAGQGIPTPGNPNFTVYFSSLSFNSPSTYSALSQHFITCLSTVGATYNPSQYIFTLTSSQAYQLTISSSGACSLDFLS